MSTHADLEAAEREKAYLGGLSNHPGERLRDGQDVREDETGLRWRYGIPGADREHGDGKGKTAAEEVETETELQARPPSAKLRVKMAGNLQSRTHR